MDMAEAIDILEEPRIVRHRFTVDDYHRMVESGVLAPRARVELIEGEVVEMAAMGTAHRAAVMRLTRLLERAVGDAAQVSVQLPLRLGHYGEPEPDFALLRPRPDFYAHTMPTGADALLVIEVADTSLPYDVRAKSPLYASHGVPEYWVIDLAGGLLRRFRDPQGNSWREVTTLQRPGVVALPGLAGSAIDLGALF